MLETRKRMSLYFLGDKLYTIQFTLLLLTSLGDGRIK
jgi:hypothetical protein